MGKPQREWSPGMEARKGCAFTSGLDGHHASAEEGVTAVSHGFGNYRYLELPGRYRLTRVITNAPPGTNSPSVFLWNREGTHIHNRRKVCFGEIIVEVVSSTIRSEVALLPFVEKMSLENRLACFYGICSHILYNPLKTAGPFWGQITQILSTLSPERDCGFKRVER